jgi:hypothetical protein
VARSFSQRQSHPRDPAEFFRDTGKVDDFDCVQRRRLIELFLDLRQRFERDRAGALDADIDIGALVRRPLVR